MSAWKVIASVFVIFAAGFVTGVLAIKKPLSQAPVAISSATNVPSPNLPASLRRPADMLVKMDKPLNLTPAQHAKIEEIIHESQERTQPMVKQTNAKVREELKNMRDQIRAELTPDQQKKFEDIFRPRPRKTDEPAEGRRRPPGSTNGSPARMRSSRPPSD